MMGDLARTAPALVHEFLARAARVRPDKTALVFDDRRYSYHQLDESAGRVAGHLTLAGVKRHDRVIIFLDNSPESIISMYGILKAGAVFVMLNATMKAPKLQYIIRDLGARAIIAHANRAKVVQGALAGYERPMQLVWCGLEDEAVPRGFGDGAAAGITHSGWEALMSRESPGGACGEIRSIDVDIATIIYTSGSTGNPKGVVCSHHSMVSVAQSIIQYLENVEDDVVFSALPLSFDYGLYQVIMTVMFGGTVVLERSFMYPFKIIERLVAEKTTGFPLVPTMAARLLQMEQLRSFDFSNLRYITSTAASLPVAHIQRLIRIFPGVRIYSMYGLTECKRVSYLPPDDIERKPSSVGIPIPNEEVFVVDGAGVEQAPGEIGELVVRGSNVMRGYWNAPEETARAYRRGRHMGDILLYTGDFFHRDEEGYLYFVGRKDGMIKTRGERVSPKEVENALCELDEIAEAAVVGVPEEILGSVIKAIIVPRPGASLDERSVLAYCRKRLEPFMVPAIVEFRKLLPKTTSGKTDTKALQ